MNNKELKAIIKMFESSDLSKLKINRGDVTIELEKECGCQEATGTDSRTDQPAIRKEITGSVNTPTYETVKAPLVGTFYEAPAPDQPPFVRLGQTVKKGETLFIIEAMKVMNEITAPSDGKVIAIHLKNGDMVMFDQIVMEID